MTGELWKFTDKTGAFSSTNANLINTLYFPLCNNTPIMSGISPDLHGDIKASNNAYLMEPVTRIGLVNSKISRNFWIYSNPKKIWSATGVSRDIQTSKEDTFKLEAGPLWHKITRENKKIGLKAEVTSFIPSSGETIEIMLVNITNISAKSIKFTPTAAIPIYARSADNLRDHRHVTSLLNRAEIDKSGIIVTPTLLFDETGHRKNDNSYFVFGIDGLGKKPEYIYPSQESFCGEAGNLEAPEAAYNNTLPGKKPYQGKEMIGALRFAAKSLARRKSFSYIIIMGITRDKTKIKPVFNNFDSLDKINRALEATKQYWSCECASIELNSSDKNFDHWLRWVNIQPELRRIFGCSFLPDFDYGKGGRGWRDLWQDCLSLILTRPETVKPLLINNFKGVRIDGSNATIIGKNPGEFIADRNNIARVWMDHGVWPLISTLFYIHQSGDLNILLEKIPYFKDQHTCRSRERDFNWTPAYGKELKTSRHQAYSGTILEHLLVENLVQFFNVGPHNLIRLENADWNDGLDMAPEFGESVAFSAMYAQNLKNIAELLAKLNLKEVTVLKELLPLLDTLQAAPVDYSNPEMKLRTLDSYFKAVKYEISGETISLPAGSLIADLEKKAEWLSGHIRKNEWLECGFFNGYYNNSQERVEGKIRGSIRMTLTGQVFAIMSGVALPGQITTLFKNIKKYLQDKKTGGFRLNTDFNSEQLDLGRAFSFIYGDKENGAFFNHMTVMLAYALYKQGRASEGFEALNSIYKMCVNSKVSKIYPCLPEYFDSEGAGKYCYLTGSASWFMFTLLTQAFGIRGEFGDLSIEPKLAAAQFKNKTSISIKTVFAARPIEVVFINPKRADFGKYRIQELTVNGKPIVQKLDSRKFLIKRNIFLSLCNNPLNKIEVFLK
ncbi:MAG: cellobiose phosphorylase [Candidatus Omnitrophica bacterium]|nr:cellobiose phosphorylase [Candidatus Omnitrophota bacterium]